MEFSILGPLQVVSEGRAIPLGAPKARALLALLLIRCGEAVPIDRLIDDLWGDHPPATARGAVQVYVSHLRKALGAATVERVGSGYAARIAPEQLDLVRFEGLLSEGRRALADGEPAEASDRLAAALALWRGPALVDVELHTDVERVRLEELRLAALEDRIEADLELGRQADVLPELEALVAEHPLRERPRRLFMLALYRVGRQADALEAYRDARETLVSEIGIEPGPGLKRLQREILAQEPWLAGPEVERPRLPTAATPLVGRDAELEQLLALVRRPDVRLVTLTGPGGIGKTRLALAAAHAAAAERRDGAAFSGLASIADPGLVPAEVARALGLREDALERELGRRELLLVVDNVEHVADAAVWLGEMLASSPAVTVVATSRAVLHLSGEHELPVPPLSPDAAVALFAQRAAAASPGFRVTAEAEHAVSEICSRLDRLPLAIELAAPHTKLLDPVSLLERLSSGLATLPRAPRDLPGRQQTLRATMDWSYGLLGEPEQRLLRRLAVFVGGFDLDAAEIVSGDEGDGLDGVAALIDNSLVLRGGSGRLSMLELVREYALERLEESGEADEARRRHADHYLELVLRAEPLLRGAEQGIWFDALDLEHGNLRAALAFLADSGDGSGALRLAGGLRRFWLVRGHLSEARRSVEAALAASGNAPLPLRVDALVAAGIVLGEQGDLDAAEAAFAEALAGARELGDSITAAVSLANLGTVALHRGDLAPARAAFEEAVELWRSASSQRGLAVAVENLGHIALAEADLVRAEELFAESETLSRASGDVRQVSAAVRARARVAFLTGDPARAVALLRESLTLADGIGERPGTASCLEALARIAAEAGNAARAAVLLGAASGLRESIGGEVPPDEIGWRDRALAAVAERLGREALDAQVAEGRALPLREAVERALEVGG